MFPAQAGKKKIVAVLPFDSHHHSTWGPQCRQSIWKPCWWKKGKFRVVDRKHLSRVIKEHELGQMGLTEMSKELGSLH